jgi:hypothetical protein
LKFHLVLWHNVDLWTTYRGNNSKDFLMKLSKLWLSW